MHETKTLIMFSTARWANDLQERGVARATHVDAKFRLISLTSEQNVNGCYCQFSLFQNYFSSNFGCDDSGHCNRHCRE